MRLAPMPDFGPSGRASTSLAFTARANEDPTLVVRSPVVPVRVFIDTSVLMEFKPVREIDWKDLLQTTDEVVVVIAPIVTKELNTHKHGKDARKRDKARSATKEIGKLHKGQQIEGRPGVTVDFGRHPSLALLAEHDLEWDAGDDQLLGSML